MSTAEKRLVSAGIAVAVLLAVSVIVAALLFLLSRQNEAIRSDIASLHEELKRFELSIDLYNENTLKELTAIRASYQEQVDNVSTALESSTIALAKDISTVDKRIYKGLSGIGEHIDTLGDAVSGLEITARGSAPPVTALLDEHELSAIAAVDPVGAKAIADQPGRLAFDAGLEAYSAGRYREASRAFLETSQLDPADRRARAYIAVADYLADPTESRGQAARPILESYSAQSGPDVIILRCLIRIASDIADWKNVSLYFSSLSLISSLSAIDYEEAALAATYAGDYADAARFWDASSDLQRGSIELLYKAGLAYRKAGQSDMAIARLEACLALDPDYEKAIAELADMHTPGVVSENDL
ncbi:MAG: hypothetical protein CVV47_04530 [Spirochaetae bacterium HGW-Spirochaetae-3]|nr:MAG: hypothetical protein CVV47_04530 [Spirochaetae bacterium HGW-Spirochaetae-3]